MAARRPSPSALQIVVAVAVLLLPVVLIYQFFSRVPEPEARAVEWQPVVAQARAESPFPVAVPADLPPDWTVVRARWTPLGKPGIDQQPAVGNTFQFGVVTPGQMYIGLDQRDTDPRGLIKQATREGKPDGESVLGGVTWQRYLSSDDRTRSLVRGDTKSTLVISGDLPYEALEAFAGTLK